MYIVVRAVFFGKKEKMTGIICITNDDGKMARLPNIRFVLAARQNMLCVGAKLSLSGYVLMKCFCFSFRRKYFYENFFIHFGINILELFAKGSREATFCYAYIA